MKNKRFLELVKTITGNNISPALVAQLDRALAS